MDIWLCKHSEPLPLSASQRPYRVGMIAECLKERGHEVTWWASDFDHVKKVKINDQKKMRDGINLELLNGIPYKKNLSLKRIKNHRILGEEFTEKINMSKKPDLIYTTVPTLDFAYRAVKYASENQIPIIVDILDLWPDVFLDLIPFKIFKKQIFLAPYEKKLKYILCNSSAIIGITDEYLDWALNKINLKKNIESHQVFPIGYNKRIYNNPPPKKIIKPLNIVFAGTIGYHFDLNTVFLAAERLKNQNIQFHIVGDGDLFDKYSKEYGINKNIIFYGWLEGDKLDEVLSISDAGIAPYRNTKNFRYNIPNKPYEYMAYGLPIITCLKGATEKIVIDNEIGYFYKEGDDKELSEKILFIYENQQINYYKSQNSKRTFELYFDARNIYSDLAEFIERQSVKIL
jgi:glycosyltransferase involved in cell wall biosynthesis